jgi:hypothetical protein
MKTILGVRSALAFYASPELPGKELPAGAADKERWVIPTKAQRSELLVDFEETSFEVPLLVIGDTGN